MAGRKKLFCSSLPNRMIVGPTVFTVTNGKGALARRGLVEEDELVGGGPTLAAELLGPPDAEPAVLADAPHHLAPKLATLTDLTDALAHLVGEQFRVVGAQFLAQGQLLGGLLKEHGAVRTTGPGRIARSRPSG